MMLQNLSAPLIQDAVAIISMHATPDVERLSPHLVIQWLILWALCSATHRSHHPAPHGRRVINARGSDAYGPYPVWHAAKYNLHNVCGTESAFWRAYRWFASPPFWYVVR